MNGESTAFIFLENPFLVEYTTLMEKYKLQYSEIENMNYNEYLELLYYVSYTSEFINKKIDK